MQDFRLNMAEMFTSTQRDNDQLIHETDSDIYSGNSFLSYGSVLSDDDSFERRYHQMVSTNQINESYYGVQVFIYCMKILDVLSFHRRQPSVVETSGLCLKLFR